MEISILIILLTTIFIIIIIMKMQNRFLNKKFSRLFFQSSKMASQNNLSFSSQLVLQDRILGVDGIHRKLMVVNGNYDYIIIDLDMVKLCTVHKEYQTIDAGALNKKTLDQYLRTISIQFRLFNGEMIDLPFYEKGSSPIFLVRECEARARDWEAMLNKLIRKEKRA